MGRYRRLLILPVLLWPFCAAGGEQQGAKVAEDLVATQPRPLVRAHAHNDYLHERPLLDALSHGFCSVEADVFLVDGKLLVGHELSEVTAERTLEALYLDPLLNRIRANGGSVFAGGPPFTLLIDFKSDGEKTYIELDNVLSEYEEMLTSIREGKVEKKAVTVIISGNRHWESIEADSTRFAGVDGRLSDLRSSRSPDLMPLVSDHWGHAFTWTSRGPMPDTERMKLQRIVQDAHNQGRRVRFWATPDRPSPERRELWTELLAADVDLISTDDLDGLKAFLLSEK